jgi:hypothetical protein
MTSFMADSSVSAAGRSRATVRLARRHRPVVELTDVEQEVGRARLDPAALCDVLCALIDGLALDAVSEPSRFPPGRIVTLVTQELEKLRA